MKTIPLLLSMLVTFEVWANEVQTFNQCYSRLTSERVPSDHPSLSKIAKGEIKGKDACLNIFNEVSLGENGAVVGQSAQNLKVLQNLHRLHGNWFLNRDLADLAQNDQNRANRAILDPYSPAAYLTYALFQNKTPVDYIWTSTDSLVSRRSTQKPEKSAVGDLPLNQFIYENTQLAETGTLLGVRKVAQGPWKYSFKNNKDKEITGSIEIFRSRGAGFLGNPTYLIKNIRETGNYRADGAVKMPRKWAKAVLSDVMCRQLPLVNIPDVDGMVDTESEVPFRTSEACTTCHATMDQMAAGIRGVYFRQFANNQTTPKFGGYLTDFHAAPEAKAYSWEPKVDNNYWKYENRGKLYFRDYKGDLIDVEFNGLAEMGQEIAKLDDPYLCLTTRYMEHFTGQSFEVTNLDPAQPMQKKVLDLAMELKKTKDLRKLIQQIIRL